MTIATIILLFLATARITILVTRDGITEPIRHWIWLWSPPADNPDRGWAYQQLRRANKREQRVARDGGLSRADARWVDEPRAVREPGFVGQILSCTDCAGVWVGAAVMGAHHFWPEPTLAIAGVAAAAMTASWITNRGGWA